MKVYLQNLQQNDGEFAKVTCLPFDFIIYLSEI